MKYISLGAKAQSFLPFISPQALSLKVFYKLRRVVLRGYHWELRLLKEGITSPLLDIYKNRGLHLDVWCWTLFNGSERNGHFQVRIHLILLWMWKTVKWHLYPTRGFSVHMNPQLGDSTEVPVSLCLCRFHFASTQNNEGLELSLPGCKHSMDCLLLGYHDYFLSTILQSSWCCTKMWKHNCSLCLGYQLKYSVIFISTAQELKLTHDKPLQGSEALVP